MTKTELAALVEAAEGPSRELDADIARVSGFGLVMKEWHWEKLEWYAWKAPTRQGPWEVLKPYTASLDAAMTLAADSALKLFGGSAGMIREAMERLSKRFSLHTQFWPESEDYGQWLARFVTAACLRAIAAGEVG